MATQGVEDLAIVTSERKFSYSVVHEVCDGIEKLLDAQHVSSGIVVLSGPRSPEYVMSLISTRRSQRTFFPAPYPTPEAWVEAMAGAAPIDLALVDLSRFGERWLRHWEPIASLNEVNECLSGQWTVLRPKLIPQRERTADKNPELAYVICTSGSTGTPKVVEVGSSAFDKKISSLLAQWPSPQGKVWLNWHHYSFDVALWEVFGCFESGGTLAICDDVTVLSDELPEFIENVEPNYVCLTPTAWRALKSCHACWNSVERLILAGESVHAQEVLEWVRGLGCSSSSMSIWNAYGPTEAIIYATSARIWPEGDVTLNGPNIGWPLPGVQVRVNTTEVTDKQGTLILGGHEIAERYGEWLFPLSVGDRQRFFSEHGVRLFETGDVVRKLRDMSLVFLGRRDRQVKLEGVRIELDAIEAIACRNETVLGAHATVAQETGGRKGIVLAIVCRQENEDRNRELAIDVRNTLQHTFPSPFLPVIIEVLPELTLRPSGKLDTSAARRRFESKGWIPS
ncbi:AMP-binding protein [Sulfobacillus thermosulfidooxidans]|uniref:AMP-binding protein n=1 Tax=Sulfobacillus thermosulfidooxidans TaxID=28034 RepID=UPI00037C4291|nr:AMP-binding protein [Sulfobacillus thermosulfidooxidans]